VPGLYCSASLREKRLTLTVTNPAIDQTRDAEIGLRGARVTAAQVVTLAAPDVHAHNSFDTPRAVEPHAGQIEASGSTLTHRFPPASVTKLELALA
jgi:alpha-N-arabinofuranosidase